MGERKAKCLEGQLLLGWGFHAPDQTLSKWSQWFLEAPLCHRGTIKHCLGDTGGKGQPGHTLGLMARALAP